MPSIHQFYGNRWMWDPNQFPNQKVSWDPINKLIYVNEGVKELDAKIDIYSAWKEWTLGSQEYPFPVWRRPAISAIGGEPITPVVNVGSTFFLENGWRIKPWPSGTGYVLNIIGNLFTREAGDNPVIPESNVTITLERSSLATASLIGLEEAITQIEEKVDEVANKVWLINASGDDNYGTVVQRIDGRTVVIQDQVECTLKRGEFLALQK